MSRLKRQHTIRRQCRRLVRKIETKISIVLVSISRLKPDPNNPRQHPERQLRHLMKNLQEWPAAGLVDLRLS
jgi:hypothetical protein